MVAGKPRRNSLIRIALGITNITTSVCIIHPQTSIVSIVILGHNVQQKVVHITANAGVWTFAKL